jgi:hypothetical protein
MLALTVLPFSASGPSLDQVTRAKAICAGCPVRRQRLAFAPDRTTACGEASEQERRLWASKDMDQDLIPELARRRRARRLPGQPRSCPYRPGSMTGLGVPAADPAPGEPRAITTIRRAMGAGRQSAITAQNGWYARASYASGGGGASRVSRIADDVTAGSALASCVPVSYASYAERRRLLICSGAASRRGLPYGGSTQFYGGSTRWRGHRAGLRGCGCGAGTGEQQREAVTVLS